VRRQKGRSCGIELLFSEKPSINGAISVPLLGNIPAGYIETQTKYQHGALAVDPAILGGSTAHRLLFATGQRRINDWSPVSIPLRPPIGEMGIQGVVMAILRRIY